MDPEGPFTGVERTLWTVWNYISEAVSRLFRPPQPAADLSEEADSHREPAGPGPPGWDEVETGTPAEEGLIEGETPGLDEETQRSGCGERKEPEGASEEGLDQTRHDDAKEEQHRESEITPTDSGGREENYKHEQCLDIGSQTVTGDVKSEEKKEAEKTVSVETSDGHRETEMQVKEEDEEEFDAQNNEGNPSATNSAPEEDDSVHEGAEETQCESEVTLMMQEDAENCECVSRATSNQRTEPQFEAIQVESQLKEEELQTAPRRESDEDDLVAATEKVNINDDVNSGAGYEDVEQEDNLQKPGGDIQEVNVPFGDVACSDAPVQSDETRLQTSELTEKEEEDVTEVQSDCVVTEVRDAGDDSADLRRVDGDPAEEKRSEAGRHMIGEFKSFPSGIPEGRDVVSEELNIPACEETQEGVPENNNEAERDENTTQRFLEAGDDEELQFAQLAEEVESEDEGNPENTEADGSLRSESAEEEQESTEDSGNEEDLIQVDRCGITLRETEELSEDVSQGLGSLFEREGTELSEIPMKTEVGNLRRDSEEEFGINEHLKEPQKEPRDETAEQPIESGIEDFLSSSKEDEAVESDPRTTAEEVSELTDEHRKVPKAEAEMMTEESFFQQLVQSSNNTDNSDDFPASGKLSAESVSAIFDDNIMEKLDTQETTGEMNTGAAQIGAEHEMRDTSEVELIAESVREENPVMEESEFPGQVETEEIENQLCDRVLETRQEEDAIRDPEAADNLVTTETKPEDLSVILMEEANKNGSESEGKRTGDTGSCIGGNRDVIDEEILDLWIETATDLSEKRSESEAGSHLDSETKAPEGASPAQGSDGSEEEAQEEEVTETRWQDDFEGFKDREEADVSTSFCPRQDEPLEVTHPESSDEIPHTESGQSRSVSKVSSEEQIMRTETSSQDQVWIQPGDGTENWSSLEEPQPEDETTDRSQVGMEPTATMTDQPEVDAPVLDFSPQRSRISVKNPRVRRPNNPRSLLNMPSVEPTPPPAAPVKPPAGVPFGGPGMGMKLPGLGSGFPVLKKTQRLVKDEESQETHLQPQEPETRPAGLSDETRDAPKQDEAPHKHSWTPPKHPGFGNPLMSELKFKLKKTSKE